MTDYYSYIIKYRVVNSNGYCRYHDNDIALCFAVRDILNRKEPYTTWHVETHDHKRLNNESEALP